MGLNLYSIKSRSSCLPRCHPSSALRSTSSIFHRSASLSLFHLMMQLKLQSTREISVIHGTDCFLLSACEYKHDEHSSLIKIRNQVYFKTNEMREMDEHFGDVYGRISDREIEISHDLAQFVLQYKELLLSCSDICGELDRYANTRSIKHQVVDGVLVYLLSHKAQRTTISFVHG